MSPAYVVVKPFAEANSAYYSACSALRRTCAGQQVLARHRGRPQSLVLGILQADAFITPRPEQDRIVAYLRAQIPIARFIKAKRDLIGLLTEQKHTIIEGAVTQGLDATTEKRHSGIDWIPRVPAHWERAS